PRSRNSSMPWKTSTPSCLAAARRRINCRLVLRNHGGRAVVFCWRKNRQWIVISRRLPDPRRALKAYAELTNHAAGWAAKPKPNGGYIIGPDWPTKIELVSTSGDKKVQPGTWRENC